MFNLSKFSLIRGMQSTSTIRTLLRNYTSARPTIILKNPIENAGPAPEEIKDDSGASAKHSIQKVNEIKTNGLVAAAFASLQEEYTPPSTAKQRPTFMEKKIAKATNIDDLLGVNDDASVISRQHALKV